jgi:exosome complex RNA-binding protein Csl4
LFGAQFPKVLTFETTCTQTKLISSNLAQASVESFSRSSWLPFAIGMSDAYAKSLIYTCDAANYQDVRATEIDKVDMSKCFRPGDIVKAKVISLGDARQYYLSTAAAECGVRFAKSEAGAIMTPLSWQEMQCPLTGAKESRKCAKPDA